MTPIILGYFNDVEQVFREFSNHTYDYDKREYVYDMVDFEGIEILLANYEQGGYEGEAYVLFRKVGKLFEVSGGHCSCYGLEGQWDPEETTIAQVRHRLVEGNLGREYSYQGKGRNIFAEELTQVLDALEQENN